MVTFELLLQAALSGLSSIITETIKDKGTGLIKKMDISLEDERKLLIKDYVESYCNNYGQLKVACVGMDAPTNLEDIYINVKFLDRSYTSRYSDLLTQAESDVRNDWSSGSGDVLQNDQILKAKAYRGSDIANAYPFLMVLGSPGIGKSTFLKKIGLEALQGKIYDQPLWPVFIELRNVDFEERSLLAEIANEIRPKKIGRDMELADVYNFAEKLLEEGRLLVLIDAIDEVSPKNKKATLKELDRFLKQYPNNRYIVSCRTAAYTFGTSIFVRFKDVVMMPFESEQVRDYIYRWFRNRHNKINKSDRRYLEDRDILAQKCYLLLRKREQNSIRKLARNPLILTLLCSVYESNLRFSENKSALLSEAISIVLNKWASEKMIESYGAYEALHSDLDQSLLSEIAFEQFKKGNLIFYKQEILAQIDTFFQNNLNARGRVDSGSVLKAIEVQSGILIERYDRTYSFSHLTLQEYLVAKFIVDNDKSNDMILNYLFDERWRETIILTAGSIRGGKGPTDFLETIKTKLDHYYADHSLKEVLSYCSTFCSDKESIFPFTAKLSASIYVMRTLHLLVSRKYECNVIKDVLCIRSLYLCSALGVFSYSDDFRSLGYILNAFFDFAVLNSGLIPEEKAVLNNISGAPYRSCKNAIRRIEHIRHLGFFDEKGINIIKNMMNDLVGEQISFDRGIEEKTQRLIKILKIYMVALKIERNAFNVFSRKARHINTLVYGTELLIQCKNSSLRVIPDKWERINTALLNKSA